MASSKTAVGQKENNFQWVAFFERFDSLLEGDVLLPFQK
jgi:hypothetical protein